MESNINDQQEFYSQTFNGLDCSYEELSGKEFEDCQFISCDFSEATFSNCTFTDCSFDKCNLSLVNLGNSRFLDVEFSECKLLGVDWTKAHWRGLTLGSPLKFQHCMMNSSSFFGLNQTQMIINDCRAHDVDFRDADFSGADFSDTDLATSLFGNTNLTGANFDGAVNYDININKNSVRNAIFCRSEATSLLDSLGIKLIN